MINRFKDYVWHMTTWIIGLMALVNGWFLIVLPHVLAIWPSVAPTLSVKPMTIALFNGILSLLAAAAKPVNQAWLKAKLLTFLAWWQRLLASGSGGVDYDKAKKYGISASLIAAALLIAQPLLDRWEGYRLTPYRDGGGVWTVCKGHTGADVDPKRTYTRAECKAFEEADKAVAVNAILSCTPKLFFSPYAAGATIDFAFNVGGRAYCSSTMARLFKAGDIRGGCAQLVRWSYDNHVWVRGLWNRRQDETRTCVKALS